MDDDAANGVRVCQRWLASAGWLLNKCGGLGLVVAILSWLWQDPFRLNAPSPTGCDKLFNDMVASIGQPYQVKFNEPIIPRAQLFEHFRQMVAGGPLTVVAGQRQAGKTVMVNSYLAGKRNVYHYIPTDGLHLGDPVSSCSEKINRGFLVKVFRKVQEKSADMVHVVFELQHSAEPVTSNSVYENLKNIVYDSHLSNIRGVLVLSNHYALNHIPHDTGRYDLFWVGNLERSEAKEFIRTRRVDADVDADVDGWLNRTGLHLSQLVPAVRRRSVGAWMQGVRKDVEYAMNILLCYKIMSVLPQAGAKFPYLAKEANFTSDQPDLLHALQQKPTRVVVYSTVPDIFHWASPYHYEAFQQNKAAT